MAKSFLCRLGIAQILGNPAYADEMSVVMQEPTFPGDADKIGLFSVSAIEEINILRQSIAERYVSHINRKVDAISRFAAAKGVELLLFPEYSIPAESLPLCRHLCDELKIAIVAGSHIVTVASSAKHAYAEIGLSGLTPQEPKGITGKVRHAVCVVFRPELPTITFSKYAKSKWEFAVIAGDNAFHSFEWESRTGKVEVQVLICIEALSEPQGSKEKHSHPRLVVIPAFSPKVEDFYNAARGLLLQGKVTLFCNIGEFGGSRAFARAEKASLWFTEKDGSAAIPPNSDGLIVAEVDLEKQFEVRRSIAEHTAVKDLRVYPVLYTFESEEAQEYVAVVESIMSEGSANALDNMRERIGPFTSLTPQVFPKLLQDKLQHFSSQIVEAGVITVNEASLWLEAIVVGETPPTHLLRWEMCNDSIRVLQEALISGRLLAKAPELVDVHKELINRRNKLTAYVRPPERSADRARPGEPSGPSVIQESAFFDRERVFDRIRVFMSQHQEAAFILAGMRGIGKTSLIQAAFRQAIPPRKSIWIQLTEGTSYERLLVVLAHNCHLRVPENLDLSSEADQQDLEHRITSYLSQTPGTVVVLDEFQYLLAGGEIEDAKIRALLVELLEKHGKNKFIFISHVAPKLGPDLQALCSDYRLQGLTDPDTIRLLQHWYQFGRDEASTGLPTPSERLLAILGGHPLATKVAARLCTERPISEVLEGISIFRELRDTMVAFILEEITLSPQEQDLLAFASVFRLPVSRDAFVQRKGEDANAVLNSLTGQFLIEASEGGYQLHPLVRDYFYEKVVSEKAIEFHKRAARYYLEAFEKEKASTKTVVPEFLGEAIHHFLAAGEKHKVQGMALYKQELGPVAKAHYRRGDLKLALKDYRVLVELNDRDADAHLHLALIYARANRWDDAEKHFGKAITVRPKAYWILQAYGNAKLRAGKIAEAEDLLTQAEEANPHHSPTLVDLGRIYQRKGDIETAKNYYKGAIELDPNHSYAYYQLARLLYDEGDMKEAYEMAKMAMSTKPTDERNRKLVRELKEIVEQLQQNSKETGSG